MMGLVPLKEETSESWLFLSTCTQRRGHMVIWPDGGPLQVRRIGLRMKPTWLAP